MAGEYLFWNVWIRLTLAPASWHWLWTRAISYINTSFFSSRFCLYLCSVFSVLSISFGLKHFSTSSENVGSGIWDMRVVFRLCIGRDWTCAGMIRFALRVSRNTQSELRATRNFHLKFRARHLKGYKKTEKKNPVRHFKNIKVLNCTGEWRVLIQKWRPLFCVYKCMGHSFAYEMLQFGMHPTGNNAQKTEGICLEREEAKRLWIRD